MAGSAGRVIVVGSANHDIVVGAQRLPGAGETVLGTAVDYLDGGKGANQAVAAARAGAPTVWIGAVGDDAAGRSALASLRSDGVDVTAAQILPGETTGTAVVLVGADAENSIVVVPGANASLDPQHVTSSLQALDLGESDVCVLGYEVSDEVVVAAAQVAGAAGARIVLNPSPSRSAPAGLLESRPIVVANQAEARDLSGAVEEAGEAAAIHALTGAAVVITRGADGAVLYDDDGTHHLKALSVKAVDTTGAGDTFAGVFAATLAAGSDRRAALARAVIAAGLSVTTPGARDSHPMAHLIDEMEMRLHRPH